MIQRLPIDRASEIQPLFQRLTESQPMCAAVLAGVYPGKVSVGMCPTARNMPSE